MLLNEFEQRNETKEDRRTRKALVRTPKAFCHAARRGVHAVRAGECKQPPPDIESTKAVLRHRRRLRGLSSCGLPEVLPQPAQPRRALLMVSKNPTPA